MVHLSFLLASIFKSFKGLLELIQYRFWTFWSSLYLFTFVFCFCFVCECEWTVFLFISSGFCLWYEVHWFFECYFCFPPCLLRNNWVPKLYTYIKDTIWWLDTHLSCKMITTIMLINVSIVFSVINKCIILTIVTTLYIRSPELMNLLNGGCNSLTHICPCPYPQLLETIILLSVSLSLTCFFQIIW